MAPDVAARTGWHAGNAQYIGRPLQIDGAIPDWYANPYVTGLRAVSDRPWWKIRDFDPKAGDIKTVWEASRFDWVPAFAQRAAQGDESELTRLNNWLDDWSKKCPAYLGANWKCGQEASFRVLHLALAAFLLDQSRTACSGLKDLLTLHLRRIAPTLSYAIGQANNHGTSEAAALFVGGSLLAENEGGNSEAAQWEQLGRRWMEDRVTRLIADDGSFSQYSVTYHRLMLDTCNLVEHWRRHMDRPGFSDGFYRKLRAATDWLVQLIDPETGGAPATRIAPRATARGRGTI
jgi:hypothetical protein